MMKLAELVEEAADVVVHSVELVVAEVEAVEAEVVVGLVCLLLEEEQEVDKQLANELQEPRVKFIDLRIVIRVPQLLFFL